MPVKILRPDFDNIMQWQASRGRVKQHVFYLVHGKDVAPLDMEVLMGATTRKGAIALWEAWNDGEKWDGESFKVSKVIMGGI